MKISKSQRQKIGTVALLHGSCRMLSEKIEDSVAAECAGHIASTTLRYLQNRQFCAGFGASFVREMWDKFNRYLEAFPDGVSISAQTLTSAGIAHLETIIISIEKAQERKADPRRAAELVHLKMIWTNMIVLDYMLESDGFEALDAAKSLDELWKEVLR